MDVLWRFVFDAVFARNLVQLVFIGLVFFGHLGHAHHHGGGCATGVTAEAGGVAQAAEVRRLKEGARPVSRRLVFRSSLVDHIINVLIRLLALRGQLLLQILLRHTLIILLHHNQLVVVVQLIVHIRFVKILSALILFLLWLPFRVIVAVDGRAGLVKISFINQIG